MKRKKNSILALVPPNKDGALVLKEAIFFQQTLGLQLFIIHVIKDPSFYEKNFQAIKTAELIESAEKELRDFIKNTIGNLVTNDFKISVKSGEIVPVLLNEISTGRHKFLIVDKSDNEYDGSINNDKIDVLVSESKIPVLTLHNDFGFPKIRNIVIPIDITESTKKRLKWAKFFAKKYDAKVTVLSALNADVNVEKSLAYKNANKIKHLFWRNSIECEVKVLSVFEKEKHEVILDYIEKEKPELVIIRTHQDSFLANTNIGEFVSNIIHGCKVPVFSVNYSTNIFKSIFFKKIIKKQIN